MLSLIRALWTSLAVWLLLPRANPPSQQAAHVADAPAWLNRQVPRSYARLLANIGPAPDGSSARGSVVAALSRVNPPYYYHWVRDGALVMRELLRHNNNNNNSNNNNNNYNFNINHKQNCNFSVFWDFVAFNRLLQRAAPPATKYPYDPLGLAEPKYYPNGTAFTGDWGRPQDDGPALRVSFAREFVERLLQLQLQLPLPLPQSGGGHECGSKDALLARIREEIYSGGGESTQQPPPLLPMADADLAVLTRRAYWENSFDLWEEQRGRHYYTVAAQTRAFKDAAWLATNVPRRGAGSADEDAAKKYLELAAAGDELLRARFFDARRKYLLASEHPQRASGLDVAVVLAACHSRNEQDIGAAHVARLEATADALKEAFANRYPINYDNRDESLGTAIGRYPEDEYYGGNPWFLATLAFAQHMYERASAQLEGGSCVTSELSRAKQLVEDGDRYVLRVRRHAGADGELDEQFDARTGFMTSARDLTWSHAALLAAARTRRAAAAALRVRVQKCAEALVDLYS